MVWILCLSINCQIFIITLTLSEIIYTCIIVIIVHYSCNKKKKQKKMKIVIKIDITLFEIVFGGKTVLESIPKNGG